MVSDDLMVARLERWVFQIAMQEVSVTESKFMMRRELWFDRRSIAAKCSVVLMLHIGRR